MGSNFPIDRDEYKPDSHLPHITLPAGSSGSGHSGHDNWGQMEVNTSIKEQVRDRYAEEARRVRQNSHKVSSCGGAPAVSKSKSSCCATMPRGRSHGAIEIERWRGLARAGPTGAT
jgi:hypothetical protein